MDDIQKLLSDALKDNSLGGDSKKQALQLLRMLKKEVVDDFGIAAEELPSIYVAVDHVDDDYLTFTSPVGNLSGRVMRESKSGYIVSYGSDFLYVSKHIQSNLSSLNIDRLGLGGGGGGSER